MQVNIHDCCSYGFGAARSRSERVRILLEELLVCVSASDWDRGGKSGIFLIGHSQGGAASAQVSELMSSLAKECMHIYVRYACCLY
jgi:hypothetical protein